MCLGEAGDDSSGDLEGQLVSVANLAGQSRGYLRYRHRSGLAAGAEAQLRYPGCLPYLLSPATPTPLLRFLPGPPPHPFSSAGLRQHQPALLPAIPAAKWGNT